MKLKQLRIVNFRSYHERQFVFSPETTIIIGPNGVGKTNILEAIFVLYQGRSFRDNDDDLIRHGANWWKIDAFFDDKTNRELRFEPDKKPAKNLLFNNQKKGRFTFREQLPVVLFEPNDLAMIHSSPASRRRYLDTVLLKFNPEYRHYLTKYERALLQRNNLLKKPLSLTKLKDQVFVWDVILGDCGAAITESREKLIQIFNESLSQHYSHIAGKKALVKAVYLPSTKSAHDSSQLVAQLTRKLDDDRHRGFTSVGPHRDDADFLINNKPVKQVASRGEVRTAVLALKHIEIELLKKLFEDTPLFLLDDVFSELDETRQNALKTASSVQTIITTTKNSGKNHISQEIIKLSS